VSPPPFPLFLSAFITGDTRWPPSLVRVQSIANAPPSLPADPRARSAEVHERPWRDVYWQTLRMSDHDGLRVSGAISSSFLPRARGSARVTLATLPPSLGAPHYAPRFLPDDSLGTESSRRIVIFGPRFLRGGLSFRSIRIRSTRADSYHGEGRGEGDEGTRVAVIERTHLKWIGGSYLAHQVDRVARGLAGNPRSGRRRDARRHLEANNSARARARAAARSLACKGGLKSIRGWHVRWNHRLWETDGATRLDRMGSPARRMREREGEPPASLSAIPRARDVWPGCANLQPSKLRLLFSSGGERIGGRGDSRSIFLRKNPSKIQSCAFRPSARAVRSAASITGALCKDTFHGRINAEMPISLSLSHPTGNLMAHAKSDYYCETAKISRIAPLEEYLPRFRG